MLRLRCSACSLSKHFTPFSPPFQCSSHRHRRSSFPLDWMKGYRTPDAQPSKRGSSVGGRGTVSAGNASLQRDRSASPSVGLTSKSPQTVGPVLRTSSPGSCSSARSSGSDPQCRIVFDICRTPIVGCVKLQKSLLEINREKRKEAQLAKEAPQNEYLRPGMVLLKRFISHNDQVKIVQKCQELGTGGGGFYRPGYSDGGKLHLQMMCLGKDWDPESRKYDKKRAFDGATPPAIPEEFKKLVDGALKASYDVVRQRNNRVNVEEELPWMSPDICIINFYGSEGRLGLHQDRDESEDSLRKGLPVVSFSIGDSAEFLYGDERHENKAQRVLLESGDVLIFGGKSRRVFHGVPTIKQNTAPKRLVEESNLKPGRLNLTFREY